MGCLFGLFVYGFEMVWIGNYESYVVSCYECDYVVVLCVWVSLGVEVVIFMFSEEDCWLCCVFDV